MKYGICLNMAAKDPEKLGISLLPQIAEAGYDYVEMAVMNSMTLTREAFKERVAAPIRESGLPCLRMNSFCGADQSFLGKENQKRALEYTKEALERAVILGAEVIVIGSGIARSAGPGQDPGEAEREMTVFFREAADLARDAGIELALEGLNRQETNMYCTMDAVMRQVGAVRKENFGALVDYFHFSLGNEDPELLAGIADQIRHVHIARMIGRVIPVTAAEDRGYVPFLRALRRGGYDRTLSIEANCPGDFGRAAKDGLRVLKEIWEDAAV